MSKVKVMVVDDSVVIRQIVTDALKADPNIEVVGVAQNGRVALEKLDSCKPDVITLDLEMPELDGLGTLEELRKRNSKVPVIVFSTLSERGAKATLDALARGASDYLCKPAGQKNMAATKDAIQRDMIPRIHALAKRSPNRTLGVPTVPSAAVASLAAAQTLPSHVVDLVVIGVSTGGPAALAEVIPKLPPTMRQPVLIVQHMPPVFTRVLAQRLTELSKRPVKEATHQERLLPGSILVAPGDQHLRVAGGMRESWVTLDQQPPENGCRPAVDPLFTTAATICGKGVLAIVLTGLGQDGTRGAKRVREAGGQVWVQDEASAAAWGMPGSVVNAGQANRVVQLANLGPEIARACGASVAAPVGPRLAALGKR